jgi:uncharacterized membrane protein
MADGLIQPDGGRNANIVAILSLGGVVMPLTPLIGVIVAHLSREQADPWLQSHYKFQIRRFWSGFLCGLIAFVLRMILIGMLFFPVILVWYIVRCVKGLNAVSEREAMPDPESWLFG